MYVKELSLSFNTLHLEIDRQATPYCFQEINNLREKFKTKWLSTLT